MRTPLESMELVAALLEAGSVEGTFAGGTVLPLLVQPVVQAQLRPTLDVDVIVRARSYFEYQEHCQVLVDAGFSPGGEDRDPLCRFRREEVVVDMMPTPYSAMGTDNPWFTYGVESAVERALPSGMTVRTLSAPVYLATKVTAFRGRGGGEYYGSKDFEDIVALLDGRPQLGAECTEERVKLRRFLSEWAGEFLAMSRHRDYVAGHVSRGAGEGRVEMVLGRIRGLAEMPND